jgi:ABC-type phosphate transport system permease subunit
MGWSCCPCACSCTQKVTWPSRKKVGESAHYMKMFSLMSAFIVHVYILLTWLDILYFRLHFNHIPELVIFSLFYNEWSPSHVHLSFKNIFMIFVTTLHIVITSLLCNFPFFIDLVFVSCKRGRAADISV